VTVALKPSERSPPRPALVGDSSQSVTTMESGSDMKHRLEDARLAHSRRAAAKKTGSHDRLAGSSSRGEVGELLWLMRELAESAESTRCS
jgi:hypothetical protein